MATIEIVADANGEVKSNGTTGDATTGLSVYNTSPAWRSWLRFPLSALAGATAVSNVELRFNVNDENAEAGEGVEITPYGDANGDIDPTGDSVATQYTRCFVAGNVWADIDCSSLGLKTADLGAAADARVLANISGTGYLSLGCSLWGLDSLEYVTFDDITSGASGNKPTLIVTYTPGVTSDPKSVSDTLSPRLDEAISDQEATSRTESLTPRIDDTITIIETSAPSETLSPRLDDTLTALEVAAVSDSLTPRLDESASIVDHPSISLGSLRAGFYYGWYPEAWNQLSIDPFSQYLPSLGYYDSADTAVIDAHLGMLAYAKIDIAIVSWWSPSHWTHANLLDLLARVTAIGSNVKVAIYYEREGNLEAGVGPNPTAAQIASDLQFLKDEGVLDHPAFAWIDGRPAIFAYGDGSDDSEPVENNRPAKRWADAQALLAFDIWTSLKVYPNWPLESNQPDHWHQYAPAVRYDQQGSLSGAISAGFWRPDETTPRLVRDAADFASTVLTALAAGLEIIFFYFNEWGEGSALEPAVGNSGYDYTGSGWQTGSGYGTYLDILHNDGLLTEEISVSDSLAVLITDSISVSDASMLVVDTVSPRLDESIAAFDTVALTETLSPRLDEAIAVVDIFQIADTISPRLDEAMASPQEGVAVSETFALTLIEGAFGTQLSSNPDGEVNSLGWGPRSGAVAPYRSTVDPIEGVASIIVTGSLSSGSGGANGPITAVDTVGVDRTFLVTGKVIAPVGVQYRIFISERNSAGSALVEGATPFITGTGEVQHVSVIRTFTNASASRMSGAVIINLLSNPELKVDDFEYYELSPAQVFDDAGVADTLNPLLTDAALGFDTFGVSDDLLPRLDDSTSTMESAAVSDTLTPRLDEASLAPLQEGYALTETLSPRLDDSISAFDTATVADSLTPRLDDAQTYGDLLALSDTLRPLITEAVEIIDVTQAVDVPGRRIWAIIYDESGNKTGQLTRIAKAWTEEAVNEVGRFELVIPTTEVDLALISEGTQLEIWYEPEGTKFFGRVEQKATVNTDDEPLTSVRGLSLGIEMLWEQMLDGVPMSNVAASAAMAITNPTSGWTNLVTGSGYVNTTNRYANMSAWRATAALAAAQGGYLRETYTKRQAEMKRGHADSGVVLTNLEQVNPYLLANQNRVAVVAGIPLYQRDGSEIINRLVPTAGSGDNVVTLQRSTRVSPYTIQSFQLNNPSVVSASYGTAKSLNVRSAGFNRVALAIVDYAGSVSGFDCEAKLGGRQMNRTPPTAHYFSDDDTTRQAFYLINPPVGDLEFTCEPLPANAGARVWIIQDADQVAPMRNAVDGGENIGTTMSTNISSIVAGDLVIDDLIFSDYVVADTPGAGQTQWVDFDAAAITRHSSGSAKLASGTSTTMSWSWSGSEVVHHLVFAIKPSRIYYIEDATSVTAYKRRTKQVNFNFNRPSTNTYADQVNWANTVYDQAIDHLQKHKDPLETIEIDVASIPLPTNWLVGDTMRFVYRGRARGDAVWLEKDVNYPIIKRRRTWDEAGIIKWKLTLGSAVAMPLDVSEAINSSRNRLDDLGA